MRLRFYNSELKSVIFDIFLVFESISSWYGLFRDVSGSVGKYKGIMLNLKEYSFCFGY